MKNKEWYLIIESRIEVVSKKNNWSLYFQSGTGCCEICDGTVTFKSSKVDIVGCLAILDFSGEKNESWN